MFIAAIVILGLLLVCFLLALAKAACDIPLGASTSEETDKD